MSFLPRRIGAAVSGTLLVLSLAACGSEEPDEAADPGESSEQTDPTPTDEAPSGDGSEDASGGGGACEYPADGAEPSAENEPPPAEPAVEGEVPATVTLNGEAVPITLDAAATPCTVNSFVSLAEQGYFDDTECHRVTTQGIFVLQCGDPTATGTGGPGYSFADELTGEETYGRGTLAMANAGPDTNGSQFFIVYDESPLDPAYNVFGSISEDGLAVVDPVADAGAEGGAPDGPPAEPATIDSVTLD